MSMVNISFDSSTGAVGVAIDGVMIPADEVFFGSYTDFDGNPVRSMTCRRKVKSDKGFDEVQETRFPPEDREVKCSNAEKVLAHFARTAAPGTVAAEVAARLIGSSEK